MANILADPGGDQFMPEYWPANRLIGELENILVKAQNIIGEIEGKQIKSLEAGKITGQLTNEQLEEISAAKVSGQLTNGQIESLETAKLLGTIKEIQIENGAISAAKIAVNAVTAEKILAGAITSLKIAAGAITTEKLAAGSVTSEKLTVKELSAITANMGIVTAGIIEGVNIRLPESENELLYPEKSKIDWVNAGVIHSWMGAFGSAQLSRVRQIANYEGKKPHGQVEIEAQDEYKNYAQLYVTSYVEATQILAKTLWAETPKGLKEAQSVLILDSKGRSSFVQSATQSPTRMYWGAVAGNTGAIAAPGSGGWTSERIEKGLYRVYFNLGFPSNAPIVTGIDSQGTERIFSCAVISGNVIQVAMSYNFVEEDITFSFIAIG